MNDEELENFYKAIDNFPVFRSSVSCKKNIRLKEGFGLVFHDDSSPYGVTLEVAHKQFLLDNDAFSKIVQDLLNEKSRRDKADIEEQNKKWNQKLQNEVFAEGNKVYRVHDTFIQHMLTTSDIASSHGNYVQKLRTLTNLLNGGNVLLVNDKTITTLQGLKDYLKSVGFYFIENDIA